MGGGEKEPNCLHTSDIRRKYNRENSNHKAKGEEVRRNQESDELEENNSFE